ncbi:MAG TPA: chemotaxis protein CheB [Abditibacteriaceae bacterium]|jgi:two-component system chemotaxis response regulator CheB
MAVHDIVVIGASAGGVEALAQLVKSLPPDFPAAVFVVLHVPSYGTSVLPQILSRRGPLPAFHPRDGQPIKPGQIYVAPPDSHLLIKRGFVRLVHGPRENGHRPAVDPLFRSASRAYGPRVVGVILSGTLDDGTSGLLCVKDRGGYAVVQDPNDALYPGMPRSAIDNVKIDTVLPLSSIPQKLVQLAYSQVEEDFIMDDFEEILDAVEHKDALESGQTPPGELSRLTCPDCGGSLWEIKENDLIRFRCHTGHGYSAESLLAEQTDSLEEALWSAYRALQESAELANRLAGRAQQRGHGHTEKMFKQQALDTIERAHIIRKALLIKSELALADPTADSNHRD